MTSRKLNVTRKELKAMSMVEMSSLLNVDELKTNITEMMDDYDIPQFVIDVMIVSLSKLIGETACTEFCDSL